MSNQTDPCDKNKSLLLDCKRELNSRKILKEGEAKAAYTKKKEKISDRNHKVCCLLKAKESHDFYCNIDIYVAIDAGNKAESISTKIGELTGKSKELKKALVDVSKCLKGIKSKAAELVNKVCEIDTQFKDSCNLEQKNILEEHFKNEKCFDSEGVCDGYDLSCFENIVCCMKDKTQEIWTKADGAFDSSVNIAGIQTFSDVASLKDSTSTIIQCLTDFKNDIDKNVGTTDTGVKEAKKEISACVKEVATNTMVEHTCTSMFESTAATLDFACKPCDPKPETTIDEICCKILEGKPTTGGENPKRHYA